MGAARSVEGLAKRWPQQHVYFLSPEFAGAARGAYKQAYVLMAQLGVIVVDGRNSPPTGMVRARNSLSTQHTRHSTSGHSSPAPAWALPVRPSLSPISSTPTHALSAAHGSRGLRNRNPEAPKHAPRLLNVFWVGNAHALDALLPSISAAGNPDS
jgi:hypothetical protein